MLNHCLKTARLKAADRRFLAVGKQNLSPGNFLSGADKVDAIISIPNFSPLLPGPCSNIAV